jgi:hypothetical protein
MRRIMNEAFLQFIWKHGLFDTKGMRTADGLRVKVLSTGMINHDAGPDFFNARIGLGKTIWAGNIEIHTRSSDWVRHRHDRDAAYDNVILHVVGENDQPVVNSKGQPIPVAELRYDRRLEKNYLDLLESREWIPCRPHFSENGLPLLRLWLHRLAIERLEDKTAEIVRRLEQHHYDWNEIFYQFLGKNFGFRTNALPFDMLVRSLPLKIAEKHRDNLFQLEALYFGAAGLLNEELMGDDYFLALKEEFSFLYSKYRMKAVPSHLWKFLRLRPVNFPTIRIAQFARLIHQSSALFSCLTETTDLAAFRKLFVLQPSSYWNTHYRFNKLSAESPKHLGETAFNNLAVNTFIPFLFVYGEYSGEAEFKSRALEFLEKLPPEENAVVSQWQKLGVSFRSAFETQALLQLRNNYCNARKCLDCPVGTRLITKKPDGTIC